MYFLSSTSSGKRCWNLATSLAVVEFCLDILYLLYTAETQKLVKSFSVGIHCTSVLYGYSAYLLDQHQSVLYWLWGCSGTFNITKPSVMSCTRGQSNDVLSTRRLLVCRPEEELIWTAQLHQVFECHHQDAVHKFGVHLSRWPHRSKVSHHHHHQFNVHFLPR